MKLYEITCRSIWDDPYEQAATYLTIGDESMAEVEQREAEKLAIDYVKIIRCRCINEVDGHKIIIG